MKVSDLDGRALNWAVAYVISDMHRDIGNGQTEFMINDKIWVVSAQGNEADDTEFDPLGDWQRVGPLIDKYAYQLSAPSGRDDLPFIAAVKGDRCLAVKDGPSFRTAFCRSLVLAQTDRQTIEIPDELCEVRNG